jgi:hypothetical protein
LHKQSINGDAPSSFPSNASGPDKAKYQAWRAKSGLSNEEAMRLYSQESDRQVRVYGTANPPTITNGNMSNNNNGTASTTSASSSSDSNVPRGLAAIPLLCAAALETRPAYIRRLGQTPLESAWWRRQEPLCSPPGTVGAIPEMILLLVARLVEWISLTMVAPPPPQGGGSSASSSSATTKMVQAFFWPAHNCLLSLWMGVVLVHTTMTSAGSVLQTIVWGARRTGISLPRMWNDQVLLCATTISGMCESHQALTCRLVGLVLLPLSIVAGLLSDHKRQGNNNTQASAGTLTCATYCVFLMVTWWYWLLFLPWWSGFILCLALAVGGCFALIELAGV